MFLNFNISTTALNSMEYTVFTFYSEIACFLSFLLLTVLHDNVYDKSPWSGTGRITVIAAGVEIISSHF